MVKKIVIGILGMGMLFSQQSCIGNTPDKTTKEQAWKEFANPQDSTRTKVWWFHGETLPGWSTASGYGFGLFHKILYE